VRIWAGVYLGSWVMMGQGGERMETSEGVWYVIGNTGVVIEFFYLGTGQIDMGK
jgi:hypothetical protein